MQSTALINRPPRAFLGVSSSMALQDAARLPSLGRLQQQRELRLCPYQVQWCTRFKTTYHSDEPRSFALNRTPPKFGCLDIHVY